MAATHLDAAAYAHVLGLYLGDGRVTRLPNTSLLSVACDNVWPGLADECEQVVLQVLATAVCRVRRKGCHDVKAYSQHWPCLFPQHGPGQKHDRPIVLEPWQEQIVGEHPGRLLRGRADIRGPCTDALDRLGIAWRPNGPSASASTDERPWPRWMSTSAPSPDAGKRPTPVPSSRADADRCRSRPAARAGRRGRGADPD